VQDKLVEEHDVARIRRAPPDCPDGVLDLVRAGDTLELFYDDCWWDVVVESVAARTAAPVRVGAAARRPGSRVEAARFKVSSVKCAPDYN
jgi:hypothetical protein